MNQSKSLFDSMKFFVTAMLEDNYLIRKSEIIVGMESHFSVMERGNMFYEIRDALSELEKSGIIKVILVSHGGIDKKFYGLPNIEIKSAKDG